MDTAQWPQGNIGIVKTVDQSPTRPVAATTTQAKPRPPQKEQPVNCPRCNSTNTKFCYYNNYSLSQPRYFCKTCRRYWTAGGSLRNVPVGGGSRKNKRSSSSVSPASAKKVLPDLNPPGQDLNLAYNPSQFNGFVGLPFGHEMKVHHQNSQNPNDSISSRGFSSFMSSIPVSDSGSMYSSGLNFPVHDQFKPSLSFSLDGINDNNGYGILQGVQENNANSSRISFPFEELKPVSTSEFDHQQDRGHGETNGYWNGLLTGGGGSW